MDYKTATRKKIRFTTARGQLSLEDLWDLPLESRTSGAVTLDSIARDLYHAATSEVSFVSGAARSKNAIAAEEMLELVKDIISTRQLELEDKAAKAAKAAERQMLLEVLESQRQESIRNMSPEAIEKRLRELE